MAKILQVIDSDLDGIGCKNISDIVFDSIRYIYTSVKHERDIVYKIYNVLKFDNNIEELYILDICISDKQVQLELLKLIKRFNLKFTYIDHHINDNLNTFYKAKEKGLNINIIYSENKSATLLYYEYILGTKINSDKLNILNSNNFKIFVRTVNDFDINIENSELIKAGTYLNQLVFDLGIKHAVHKIKYDYMFTDEFKKYMKRTKNEITEYIKILSNNNLIYKKDDLVIVFCDKYFSFIPKLFTKDTKIIIMATPWGAFYIRINNYDNTPLEDLKKYQEKAIQYFKTFTDRCGGHIKAYSCRLDDIQNNSELISLYTEKIANELQDIYKGLK